MGSPDLNGCFHAAGGGGGVFAWPDFMHPRTERAIFMPQRVLFLLLKCLNRPILSLSSEAKVAFEVSFHEQT